jgi:hypothetical protein
MNSYLALQNLFASTGKTEAEQDELIVRIKEFVRLEQYDNARFTAKKILADNERAAELHRIDVNEQFIRRGQYREAGIRFMQLSMYDDAKKQFSLAGDDELVKLAETCAGSGNLQGLEVLSAFVDMGDNETVRKIIVQLVGDDLQKLKEEVTITSKGLKKIKERKDG